MTSYQVQLRAAFLHVPVQLLLAMFDGEGGFMEIVLMMGDCRFRRQFGVF
jgi:hypothetical protein